MSREDPQFRVRLPIELKEKIQKSAVGHKRSMNSQIVAVLAEYYEQSELRSDSITITLSNETLASNDRIKELLFEIFDALGTTAGDEENHT